MDDMLINDKTNLFDTQFQASEPELEPETEERVYADKELEKYENLAMKKRYDIQNIRFWEEMLPTWIENFRNNLPLIWAKAKSYKDIPEPKPNTPCVVIGASPSLSDQQIKSLIGWPGITFCCNKSFVRVLKLGLVPNWVVCVHKTPTILDHFKDPIVDQYKSQIEVLSVTSVHPTVLKRLSEFKNLYLGNDIIDPRYYKNMTEMMVQVSKIPAMTSVGNVGSLMVVFANEMRCDPVALIGIEFSEKPNPTWSQEEANKRKYYYIPERNEYIAMGSGFVCYADLLDLIMKHAQADPRYHTKFINLTPTGFFRLNGTEFMDIEDYVKKFKKRKLFKK